MGLEAGTLHLHSCRGLGWLLVWFAGSGERGQRELRGTLVVCTGKHKYIWGKS